MINGISIMRIAKIQHLANSGYTFTFRVTRAGALSVGDAYCQSSWWCLSKNWTKLDQRHERRRTTLETTYPMKYQISAVFYAAIHLPNPSSPAVPKKVRNAISKSTSLYKLDFQDPSRWYVNNTVYQVISIIVKGCFGLSPITWTVWSMNFGVVSCP